MKNISTHQEIQQLHVEEISTKLFKKLKKSFSIFLITNISIFLLIALITVFNLFALRFHRDENTLIYFLIIGIITNISAFFRTILGVFKFKQLYNLSIKKIKYMSEELNYYENKKYEYAKRGREHLLLDKIKTLFNAEDLD